MLRSTEVRHFKLGRRVVIVSQPGTFLNRRKVRMKREGSVRLNMLKLSISIGNCIEAEITEARPGCQAGRNMCQITNTHTHRSSPHTHIHTQLVEDENRFVKLSEVKMSNLVKFTSAMLRLLIINLEI